MPVQVSADRFIQFNYYPDYLHSKKWIGTIPDVDAICQKMGLQPEKYGLIIDGGNVIRASNKVMMCDKVFKENPGCSKQALINELELLFDSELFFIPRQPGDYTGHADGMLRFLDDDTLLINNYENEPEYFRRAFNKAIKNTRLNYVEIPYKPHPNPAQANGCYINYLQMNGTIILPTFGIKEDDEVLKHFEKLFIGHKIATIDANEIANEGGVLNCITWNILTSSTFLTYSNLSN